MTWIGVHNAIISTAYHANVLEYSLFFSADAQLDVNNVTKT